MNRYSANRIIGTLNTTFDDKSISNGKPVMLVLAGLPASGKSYLVNHILNAHPDTFVYSTDAYIEIMAKKTGLTYEDCFSDYIKEASLVMNETVANAFDTKESIIWDQTNLTIGKRAKICRRADDFGYHKILVFYDIPNTDEEIESYLTRLKTRKGKKITEGVIRSMVMQMEFPSETEDFNEFWTIAPHF